MMVTYDAVLVEELLSNAGIPKECLEVDAAGDTYITFPSNRSLTLFQLELEGLGDYDSIAETQSIIDGMDLPGGRYPEEYPARVFFSTLKIA